MRITEIIKLLQSNDFYGVSETIEVAKGKYQAPMSFIEYKRKFKRWLKK